MPARQAAVWTLATSGRTSPGCPFSSLPGETSVWPASTSAPSSSPTPLKVNTVSSMTPSSPLPEGDMTLAACGATRLLV